MECENEREEEDAEDEHHPAVAPPDLEHHLGQFRGHAIEMAAKELDALQNGGDGDGGKGHLAITESESLMSVSHTASSSSWRSRYWPASGSSSWRSRRCDRNRFDNGIARVACAGETGKKQCQTNDTKEERRRRKSRPMMQRSVQVASVPFAADAKECGSKSECVCSGHKVPTVTPGRDRQAEGARC